MSVTPTKIYIMQKPQIMTIKKLKAIYAKK